MTLRSLFSPIWISIAAALCLIFFFIWMASVMLPVAAIELGYQYNKFLQTTFNVSDIRGLIMPQFRLDLHGYTSKHTTNGITIPAIFVDEPVIYNIDPNDEKAYTIALKQGIAHASSTNFPGTGGLGYYFAHSSTPTFVKQLNAVFYLLGKLQPGDDVYIWHDKIRADYKVTKTAIIYPNDLSFLKAKYPTETVVLQTCWPPGTSEKRLLVFAEYVPKK